MMIGRSTSSELRHSSAASAFSIADNVRLNCCSYLITLHWEVESRCIRKCLFWSAGKMICVVVGYFNRGQSDRYSRALLIKPSICKTITLYQH